MGSYAGRPALVLAVDGTYSGEDHQRALRLQDLPGSGDCVAGGGEQKTAPSTRRASVQPAYANQVTYRYAFATPESLQTGFFEPATLGWHAPDPVAALPTSGQVYWLGQDSTPEAVCPN